MTPADPTTTIPQQGSARAVARPRGSLAASHPNLVFWLSLALLNGLLFVPLYLLNLDDSSFLPWQGGAGQSPEAVARQLFAWRNNLDVFRLSLEVLLLAALWVNVRWLWRRQRLYRVLFTVVYALAFSYALYESISLSLYQIDPVFYAQYRLATDGVPFVVEQLRWPLLLYLAGLAVALAAIAVLVILIRTLIGGAPPQRLSRWTRLATAALALWAALAPLVLALPLASPRAAVNSLAAKLEQNVGDSLALWRKIDAFDSRAPERAYDYGGQKLAHKPDIYLIFVESYGSVLYKRPDWRRDYEALLAELEQDLAGQGWHAATALSESPTWGGGSWMAYTSALFGLRVDNHTQYLALVDEYQDKSYPDLGRFLQAQDYHSAFVTAIARELRASEQERYENFYGVDDWVKYSRLDYQGPRYGWGPAPPDQYVLSYVKEEVLGTVRQPTFLFYITQNSHYPWTPQPEVVQDWRTLNQPAADPSSPLPDQLSQATKRRNYLDAVEYQLRFLVDFILETASDDAIYVLVGDHQPQQVSRRTDGFETPLHVISRDAGFVQSLRDYGFDDGLLARDLTADLRHEGFYSLFVRALLASYGQGDRVLPDYLPYGVVSEQPATGLQSE
jgi:hypothetical protein